MTIKHTRLLPYIPLSNLFMEIFSILIFTVILSHFHVANITQLTSLRSGTWIFGYRVTTLVFHLTAVIITAKCFSNKYLFIVIKFQGYERCTMAQEGILCYSRIYVVVLLLNIFCLF